MDADNIIGEIDPDLFKCACCEKWFKYRELTRLYLKSDGSFNLICRETCMKLSNDINLEYFWETLDNMKRRLKEKLENDKS